MDREHDLDPDSKEILLSKIQRRELVSFFKSIIGGETMTEAFGLWSDGLLVKGLVDPLAALIDDIEDFIELRERKAVLTG